MTFNYITYVLQTPDRIIDIDLSLNPLGFSLIPIFKIILSAACTVLRNLRLNNQHNDIYHTQYKKIQATFLYGIGLSSFVCTVMVLSHCNRKAAFHQRPFTHGVYNKDVSSPCFL